jgi:Zn-dependent protease
VHSYAEEGRYVELASWIFWVLLSITLHELAHGWTAIWQGDDTPIRLNRMTPNPVVHMGGRSLLIFALCGIAWGQMPVNPYRFKDGRRGDVYGSAAGPAMNLLIALACLLVLTAWVRFGPAGTALYENASMFLFLGVGLNLVLAPLNMLPIPPLDGSHVLAGVSRRARELFEHPQAQLFGMFAFIAIFFMSPIGDLFFEAAWRGAIAVIDGVGGVVGNPTIWEVIDAF